MEESASYQSLMERYNDLSSGRQLLVRSFGGLLFFLMVISPPISKMLASSDAVADFERKRNLTRQLLRVVRDSASAPNILPAPDLFSLQTRFETEFQQMDKLMPEQIFSIQSSQGSGQIIPSELALASMTVDLRNLNLRQVVTTASRLASIPSVKMTDLEITASPERPGYLYMKTKVVALRAPEPPKVELEEPKKKSRPRNKPTENETEEE
jgi:hypothetical protein